MNFEVVLLIAISLLLKFDDGMTGRPKPTETTFQGTYVMGEKAERKFAEQLEHRNALIEAAQAEKNEWDEKTKQYIDDHAPPLSWMEQIQIKHRHKITTSARKKFEKLNEKYKEPGEAFCKLRHSKASDICADAFQNLYFKEKKLTYRSGSPYAEAVGFLIIKKDDQVEPVKHMTKFRECVAEEDNDDASKTTKKVYLKASDEWKKGRRLKFFILASKKDSEPKEFTVEAYLENK